jgi:hypothetical protein
MRIERSPRLWRVAAPSLAALAALAAPAACDSGTSDQTTGERVVLHAAVRTDPAFTPTFTTNFGWNVTLTKAAFTVGALYFFNGPPAFTRLELPASRPRPPGFIDYFDRLLGVREAWAHPGHYQAGDAVGQILSPSSYDLLSGAPWPLADGDGVTGSFRSGSFLFANGAPVGPAAAALEGHAAFAEGSATKADGSTPAPIYFRVYADFAEIAAEAADGAVDGCVFDPAEVSATGTVTLSVSPNVWFNLVDFSAVAPGTPAAPTLIGPADKARVGFVTGLAQLNAYRFSYTP